MKTLKDFYIVVTKQNKKQLEELLNIPAYEGYNISFDCDDSSSRTYMTRIKNKQRISLSKLKRYIDNTPTREGLKKAQNASNIYKYKYEQCKKDNEEQAYYIEEFRSDYKELREDYNQVKSVCTALDYKLTESTNNLKEVQTTLRDVEKLIPQENKLIDSTVVDWVNDVIKERDKWKGLHYDSSTGLDLLSYVYNELKHSKERLQYNLDNLRSEREQLTNLAKKDINLGKKTLIEWVEYIQENNKHMYKECTVLGISNKNLELNNTKLNLENDKLNKELRKYKIVAMCSLLLTLLALGLWF